MVKRILFFICAFINLCVLAFFIYPFVSLEFSPWDKLSLMLSARTEMGSAVVNGEIYLVGGYIHPSSVSLVEKYVPSMDKWFSLADLPVALDHASAVSYGNYIYEIGGLYLAEKGSPSDKVFRYSISENKWEIMTSLPQALGSVSSVLIGKKIHVFGGIKESGVSVDSHYVYDVDLNTWSLGSRMPIANDHMAVATDGVKVFLAGGREKFDASIVSRLFIYDSLKDSWQEGLNLPTPRGDVYGAIVGDDFIVAGGENDEGKVFDRVDALNLKSMTWHSLPRLPSVRHGASAVSLDGYYYLIGGRDADHSWGYTDLNERLKIK